MTTKKTYLALGDSMSIDEYTGVEGGGAVKQFYKTLGSGWTLDDRTFDGCMMAGVPRDGRGDLITLTIGGNDLLLNKEEYLKAGIDNFVTEHRALLQRIRKTNPDAVFIVGDVYAPAAPLSKTESAALEQANAAIAANCDQVGAILVGIHEAFLGNEDDFLCLGIEPTLEGANAIVKLFKGVLEKSRFASRRD